MKDVPRNMRRTGMLLFRDGFLEACNGEKLMCVVHVAHAAEILLKARIAQEHPLLIFSKLPSPNKKNDYLGLIDLLENGRTLGYEELPNQLWATTGIKIEGESLEKYKTFGRIRNQIIHFSIPNENAPDVLTIRYSLEFLDPLVESFWGRSVFDFIRYEPFTESSRLLSCGLLEDKIREILPIDSRLRRVLGEQSKENWEFIHRPNEHEDELLNAQAEEHQQYEEYMASKKYEEYEEENNLSAEDYQEYDNYMKEYDKYREENPEDPPNYISEGELIEQWETFLKSF